MRRESITETKHRGSCISDPSKTTAPRTTPAIVRTSIGPEPLDGEAATMLVAQLDAYLADRYPPEENFLDLEPAEVTHGRGVFLVARCGDTAVGCGALRLVEPTVAEIKRLYVEPGARQGGLGMALLTTLELTALRSGVTTVVAETGNRQPEALALFQKAGFSLVPCGGRYAQSPSSRCLAKTLSDQAERV